VVVKEIVVEDVVDFHQDWVVVIEIALVEVVDYLEDFVVGIDIVVDLTMVVVVVDDVDFQEN